MVAAEVSRQKKWVNTPIGKAAKAKYVTAAEAAMESRMKLG